MGVVEPEARSRTEHIEVRSHVGLDAAYIAPVARLLVRGGARHAIARKIIGINLALVYEPRQDMLPEVGFTTLRGHAQRLFQYGGMKQVVAH